MTNCIWINNEDPASCLTEEVRTARKLYSCGECGEPIHPGHKYEYVRGLWEGDWSTHRTCARCVNVRTDYFKGGWIFGQVVADFQEAFGFDYRKGIPKDFAPCSENRPPRDELPPSSTVPMGGA